MAQDLMQDFDAHVPFSFAAIPESPAWANRSARVKRWFFIAFAESWLAVLLFRLKKRLRAAGVPALPVVCDLISRALFRVSIGNAVEIGPGLMVTHGNVVIDGRTRIGKHCQINPWVTIGLSNSRRYGFSADGPTIGDEVHIGTGAKILGPVRVGDHARIGANAVVIDDVPANTTVVGAPARVVGAAASAAPSKNGAAADAASGDGASGDEELVAHMRQAIVDYKLRRQSLRSLVDTLNSSFEAGSDDLRSAQQSVHDDLSFLDAIAAVGGEESAQVTAAVVEVERVLLSAVVGASPG
jgi:serine O-acetyltransferase